MSHGFSPIICAQNLLTWSGPSQGNHAHAKQSEADPTGRPCWSCILIHMAQSSHSSSMMAPPTQTSTLSLCTRWGKLSGTNVQLCGKPRIIYCCRTMPRHTRPTWLWHIFLRLAWLKVFGHTHNIVLVSRPVTSGHSLSSSQRSEDTGSTTSRMSRPQWEEHWKAFPCVISRIVLTNSCYGTTSVSKLEATISRGKAGMVSQWTTRNSFVAWKHFFFKTYCLFADCWLSSMFEYTFWACFAFYCSILISVFQNVLLQQAIPAFTSSLQVAIVSLTITKKEN